MAAILDDEATRGFLRCLTFRDAKRPITKAVLQRIDLGAIAARADRAALLARADARRACLLAGDANATAAPFAWPATLETLLCPPARTDEAPLADAS